MFNWLISSKKKHLDFDSDEEYEDDVTTEIPKPPKPDMKVALMVRKKKYISTYHPDGFETSIIEAYNEREIRKIHKQVIMDNLSREINFEYRKKKDKSILRNYFMNILSMEIMEEYKKREKLRLEYNIHKMLMSLIRHQIEEEEEIHKEKEEIHEENDEEESSSEEYVIQAKKRKNEIPVFEWNENYSDIKFNYSEDKWSNFDETEFNEVEFNETEVEFNEIVIDKIESKFEPQNVKNSLLQREHPEGYLELYIGPMFSGKSSKILFKLSSMADQRFNCLYINSVKDIRETESQDNFVTTHNSSYSNLSSKITKIKVSSLREVSVSDYDYIAIDELQFFDDEYTVGCIDNWVSIYGKYVLVASLDGDCYRRKFGRVLDLIPHADEINKLTAYCDICRDNYGIMKKAPFTARMTSDTTAELVGGTNIYKAMCRSCHDFHVDITSHYC